MSLPPAVSSVLLSQLAPSTSTSTQSGSSTVVAALTQRARLLQEENDELYELLRYSETGRLKEEVRGLRRLVQRLQVALRRMESSSSFQRGITDWFHFFRISRNHQCTFVSTKQLEISEALSFAVMTVANWTSRMNPISVQPKLWPTLNNHHEHTLRHLVRATPLQ